MSLKTKHHLTTKDIQMVQPYIGNQNTQKIMWEIRKTIPASNIKTFRTEVKIYTNK